MVRLTTLQHRITSFRQVATQSSNGFSMPFGPGNSLVESHHMAAGHAVLISNNGITRLSKGAFKVVINIWSGLTVVRLAARRLYSGHCPTVTGQVCAIPKTCHIPNLKGDEDCQYVSYAGQGHKQLHLRGYLYDLPDTLLYLGNLLLQLIEKSQLLFHGVPGFGWQFHQTLLNKIPSSYPKKVAYLLEGNGIFGKGSMDAVFQAGANMYQENPHACQLSLVSKFSRRNPDGRQRTVEGQNSQTPGISSLSVLLILPIISLALPALTRVGICPAFSISSINQYQFPTLSTAI